MKAAMDGGAWLVVAAAFSSSFVVFGVVYSFGVFLQPIATEFHVDPTAAFFSITAVVYYGLGAFAGRAADRFGPRAVVAAGAAILGLGLGLTAVVHQIWAGYLTYGLGVGIGGACCYVPPLASVGALFVPFVFLPAFARDHGASDIAAAALVSLTGGTSIVGRLVLGPIGDRIGVLRRFKITTLMMAISYAIWLFSSSYVWLTVFVVVLGANYGSRIGAVPAVLIELFGLDNLGTALGALFTATGLATLLGPPLAGVAVDLSGSYYGAILFALAVGILGFAAIATLKPEPFDPRRSDRA